MTLVIAETYGICEPLFYGGLRSKTEASIFLKQGDDGCESKGAYEEARRSSMLPKLKPDMLYALSFSPVAIGTL